MTTGARPRISQFVRPLDIAQMETQKQIALPTRVTPRLPHAAYVALFAVCLLLGGVTFSFSWWLDHQGASDTYQKASVQLGLGSPGGTQILGIQGDGVTPYPGIPWLRLSYSTCGSSNLSGVTLQKTIAGYHRHGVHILLLICQRPLAHILDVAYLHDAAQSRPDAVQCGNEQMKNDPPHTRYIPPDRYARFFDLCERSVHTIHPDLPVLMGSLDPRIVGPDNALLQSQVNYLNDMQTAMNTTVNPGSNWTWESQRIGLNDSSHNGYPSSADNNLYNLFMFWSQQFGVDVNGLSDHLWVVEGTACFTGCGLHGKEQIAVSHVLTLITDVLTATKYHIPFFSFTGRDFEADGVLYPNGVLDVHGDLKPLRQDLPMGAHQLTMTCGKSLHPIYQQEQLLASLYAGCQLPSTYTSQVEGDS